MDTGTSPLPSLVPVPDEGRRFAAQRRVRWGDADPTGRLRLDAVARYLQDLANDDSRDAGIASTRWVVRSTAIDIVTPVRVGEELTLTTFASGIGAGWAERRTVLAGRGGGRVEAASIWVCVDDAGRPGRLGADFLAVYGATAGGRRVPASLRNPAPPSGVARRPWPLRSSDLDGLGHVNNAATWAPVEDELARLGVVPAAAYLEHGAGIGPDDRVALASAEVGGGIGIWLLVEHDVRASVVVVPAGG